MDPGHALGIAKPQHARDGGAEVAAAGGELLVAEDLRHQLCPEVGGLAHLQAVDREGRGEAEAGQGGGDDVEGVLRVAPVGGGVGQRPNDLLEVPEGPGPAVGEDEGGGVRSLAAFVDEVHGHAVEVDLEVREGVESRFGLAPVVVVAPGAQERLEVVAVHAEAPVVVREIGRETRVFEPSLQVGDIFVRDGNGEGLGLHGSPRRRQGAVRGAPYRRERRMGGARSGSARPRAQSFRRSSTSRTLMSSTSYTRVATESTMPASWLAQRTVPS